MIIKFSTELTFSAVFISGLHATHDNTWMFYRGLGLFVKCVVFHPIQNSKLYNGISSHSFTQDNVYAIAEYPTQDKYQVPLSRNSSWGQFLK